MSKNQVICFFKPRLNRISNLPITAIEKLKIADFFLLKNGAWNYASTNHSAHFSFNQLDIKIESFNGNFTFSIKG